MAYLRTGLWWVVLGAVWLVAIGGFLSKVWLTHRVESVSIGRASSSAPCH